MAVGNIDVVLRLLNGRRFQSSMRGASASVRAARAEMDSAAVAGSGLGAAGRVGAGGMYALGAAARVAGYAVSTAAAAWVAVGLKFNATIESNTLALEHFTGSASAAKQMTQDLFDIARSTPFSFADITAAARRFMAFGFSVQETTGLLKTMGDTMSLTGGGTDEIMRFAKALGDIRAKGRLMQQEMNQLSNLNIPIREVLAKGGLDLTAKQLKNVGRAGIDAETAVTAIKSGLDQIYGGGAQKYLKTFNGQWQRLKDNIAAAAGTSTTGIFAWMKDGLKTLNDTFEKDGSSIGKTMRGVIEGIIGGIGGAIAFIVERGAELIDALKPAAPFFKNVLWPIIKGFAMGLVSTLGAAWKVFIGIIKLVAPVLGAIGKFLAPLKPVFMIVGFALSFMVGWVIKLIGFIGRVLPMFGFIGRAIGAMITPIRIFYDGIAKLIGIFMKWREAGVFSVQGLKIIFWDILKWFGSLPAKFLGFGKAMGKALVTGLLALFGAAGSLAGKIGRKIADWLNDHTPFGDHVGIGPVGFDIPKLATGGLITAGGFALVGERGPEVVRLPSGSSVIPNRPAQARVNSPSQVSQSGRGVHFDNSGNEIIQLVVDGRVLTEVVGRRVSRNRARS
jgi:tape measure domain-containing protein